MAITDVLSMIFHFQATRTCAIHIRSLSLLMTHMQQLFGNAFAEWVRPNFEMFPHIIGDILELIETFSYHGCIFPSTRRHLQEHLLSIMSYSHQACFHPNMNQFRNFFDERQHWAYNSITNAAHTALTTGNVHWINFMGPVADLLRQWNQTAVIQHNHKIAFGEALWRISREEWHLLPNRINWYIINNFTEVATALLFDTYDVHMQY